VHDLKHALQQPQVAHNGTIVSFEDPVHGTVRAIASPLKLSRVPQSPLRTPPRLGQHTDEILAEFGISGADVAGMRDAGLLG
jgi:crotonobetainyl-CoA:carnitine CoA-transferase CaiB-like acyl-CoA transferase